MTGRKRTDGATGSKRIDGATGSTMTDGATCTYVFIDVYIHIFTAIFCLPFGFSQYLLVLVLHHYHSSICQ